MIVSSLISHLRNAYFAFFFLCCVPITLSASDFTGTHVDCPDAYCGNVCGINNCQSQIHTNTASLIKMVDTIADEIAGDILTQAGTALFQLKADLELITDIAAPQNIEGTMYNELGVQVKSKVGNDLVNKTATDLKGQLDADGGKARPCLDSPCCAAIEYSEDQSLKKIDTNLLTLKNDLISELTTLTTNYQNKCSSVKNQAKIQAAFSKFKTGLGINVQNAIQESKTQIHYWSDNADQYQPTQKIWECDVKRIAYKDCSDLPSQPCIQITPTPSPTHTPTNTPTQTPTPSPTHTPTNTPTETPTPSPTHTPTNTPTHTPTPSPTHTPTNTPTHTPTPSPTHTPTNTPTQTPTPSPTHTPAHPSPYYEPKPPYASPSYEPKPPYASPSYEPNPPHASPSYEPKPPYASPSYEPKPPTYYKRAAVESDASGESSWSFFAMVKSLSDSVQFSLGIGEDAKKARETLAQLKEIYRDEYANLKSEQNIYNLGVINYFAKETNAGRMKARDYEDMNSLLATVEKTNIKIGIAIETVKLHKLIGLQSWAHKYFQVLSDSRIDELEALKESAVAEAGLEKLLLDISKDCQEYLSDEALESALDNGMQSLFTSSSSHPSKPNLRNNPWSSSHSSINVLIDCRMIGSQASDYQDTNLPVSYICFSLPQAIMNGASPFLIGS